MQDNLSELEELLALAESDTATNKPRKKNHVDYYIKKFGIESSDTEKVANLIIYRHYAMWRKRNRLSRIGFFREFSKFFDRTQDNTTRYYKIAAEPFDTSQEGMFKARTHLRKEKQRAQKKGKPKSTK